MIVDGKSLVFIIESMLLSSLFSLYQPLCRMFRLLRQVSLRQIGFGLASRSFLWQWYRNTSMVLICPCVISEYHKNTKPKTIFPDCQVIYIHLKLIYNFKIWISEQESGYVSRVACLFSPALRGFLFGFPPFAKNMMAFLNSNWMP